MSRQSDYHYKILRKSDGLYSEGGITPKFSKNGKEWHGLGPLKNHFNMIEDALKYSDIMLDLKDVYKDCIIIKIHVVKTQVKQSELTFPFNDI